MITPRRTLLFMSSWQRVAIAASLAALLWLAVAWALAEPDR